MDSTLAKRLSFVLARQDLGDSKFIIEQKYFTMHDRRDISQMQGKEWFDMVYEDKYGNRTGWTKGNYQLVSQFEFSSLSIFAFRAQFVTASDINGDPVDANNSPPSSSPVPSDPVPPSILGLSRKRASSVSNGGEEFEQAERPRKIVRADEEIKQAYVGVNDDLESNEDTETDMEEVDSDEFFAHTRGSNSVTSNDDVDELDSDAYPIHYQPQQLSSDSGREDAQLENDGSSFIRSSLSSENPANPLSPPMLESEAASANVTHDTIAFSTEDDESPNGSTAGLFSYHMDSMENLHRISKAFPASSTLDSSPGGPGVSLTKVTGRSVSSA
ncbi:hypothetical protein GYMLUDRAFT_240609 [Collybiopsis luxurians FD-317 M1]|nr:hypothetical protein GYMLUDRAFT_240609 [Collybiopsis luxurians FD-317 M1]